MKNPFIKIILVFIAGIIVSRLFWFLGYLPNLFKNIVDPGNCQGIQTMTLQMYICSAIVAFKTLIGPIFFLGLIFFFRKAIFNFVNRLRPKIPEDFQFLLNPLIATLIFTILWSGSHYSTSYKIGFIGQRSFPVVVGLFTYVTTNYYLLIQERLASFFIRRDKLPKIIRYLLAILIPIILSLIITFQNRVSAVALKEQFIVIVSLISGYLVLIPKKGTINLKKLQ